MPDLTKPSQRLAAFHADRRQPAAAPATAEGALRLYEQRRQYLNQQLELRPPMLMPLGVAAASCISTRTKECASSRP